MQVAEPEASGTPDVMQPEDSVDTIIRQAAGREPLLCVPRASENTEHWLQLLHVFDQQGWPLLYPLNLKIQMQKCKKCPQEFCSIVNYRRHLRVHNRFQKLDKDSTKIRDVLGAYWDKLSVEEAKEVVSFENAMLEDAPGSSILNALTTLIDKHGFFLLPLSYLTAGAALLDIVQSKPSGFPISSQELFRILDDASEKTCFLGTAVSMQKYVFDGDARKICLELKNLVACACFLLEQNLTKAWIADKDAESLRCQNQLVEEEAAAQKRQDEILKKKNKKKLRQKQQNAKEQKDKDEIETKGNFESTVTTLSPVEASLDTFDFETNNPEKFSSDSPSHVPFRSPDTNEETDGNNQSGYAFDTDQNIETQSERGHSQWRIVQKKAREQRNRGGAEIKRNVDSTLKALSRAKASSDTYKNGAHNPKKIANDASSHVPSQCPDTNEGSDGDAQSAKDVGIGIGIVQKKAREQIIKGGAEIKGKVDSTLKALSPAKVSSGTYKIGAHNLEKIADGAPSHVPSQCLDTNEGSVGDAQSGKDVGTDQNIEKQSEHGHNHGDVEVARGKGLPISQPAVASDLNTNQNSKISKLEVTEKYGTQGDQSVAAIANGDKAKPKPEVNSVVSKTIAEKEPDLVKNHEVLIGSISVNVGNRIKSEGNVVASRKDRMVDNVAKQNTSQDKPIKPKLTESGTKQSTVKPQMPIKQLETKDPLPVQSGGTEVDAGYANEDRQDLSGPKLHSTIFDRSNISDLEGATDPGKSQLPFSIESAKAFLAQRWKETMSSDHVVLVVSKDSDSEPSECHETQDLKIEACQSASGADSCNNLANAENKSLPTSKVSKSKHRKKSGKGAKVKNTPKQKTDN